MKDGKTEAELTSRRCEPGLHRTFSLNVPSHPRLHPCPSSLSQSYPQRRPLRHGPSSCPEGRAAGTGPRGRAAGMGRTGGMGKTDTGPGAASPGPARGHGRRRMMQHGQEREREAGRGQSPAGPPAERDRGGAGRGRARTYREGDCPRPRWGSAPPFPPPAPEPKEAAGRGAQRCQLGRAGAARAAWQDPPRGGGSARHFRGRSRRGGGAGSGGAPCVPSLSRPRARPEEGARPEPEPAGGHERTTHEALPGPSWPRRWSPGEPAGRRDGCWVRAALPLSKPDAGASLLTASPAEPSSGLCGRCLPKTLAGRLASRRGDASSPFSICDDPNKSSSAAHTPTRLSAVVSLLWFCRMSLVKLLTNVRFCRGSNKLFLEYPEWEGTHKDHLSSTPGLAQRGPSAFELWQAWHCDHFTGEPVPATFWSLGMNYKMLRHRVFTGDWLKFTLLQGQCSVPLIPRPPSIL